MYELYWNLKEKPFENTPDPKYIYYSSLHKEAISRLLYAVRERKGAALLTGEYGSGKTLLSRILLEELAQEHIYQYVVIFNPRLDATDLLRTILIQLSEQNQSTSKAEILSSLYNIFYSIYRSNRHTVIVIDEAQAIINEEVFEELRLLLNFQLNNAFLLTLVILGQPELKVKIAKLPQLLQRLSIRYHLNALNEVETKEYILHRLSVAGATIQPFTEDAFKDIYFFSAGIPRQINTICDLALLVGYGENLKEITRDVILKVAEDIKPTPSLLEKQQGLYFGK
ncbi:MAG: AAA family ATPase [Candidatus Omnitrophica bacterium]|nr:AAA family ATPase [Candidatus Omnitrophota bacterium]